MGSMIQFVTLMITIFGMVWFIHKEHREDIQKIDERIQKIDERISHMDEKWAILFEKMDERWATLLEKFYTLDKDVSCLKKEK